MSMPTGSGRLIENINRKKGVDYHTLHRSQFLKEESSQRFKQLSLSINYTMAYIVSLSLFLMVNNLVRRLSYCVQQGYTTARVQKVLGSIHGRFKSMIGCLSAKHLIFMSKSKGWSSGVNILSPDRMTCLSTV